MEAVELFLVEGCYNTHQSQVKCLESSYVISSYIRARIGRTSFDGTLRHVDLLNRVMEAGIDGI